MEERKPQVVLLGGGWIGPDRIVRAIAKLEGAGFHVTPSKEDELLHDVQGISPDITKTCFAGRHLGVSAYDISKEFTESFAALAWKYNRDELYITKKIRRLSKPKKHQRMINL